MINWQELGLDLQCRPRRNVQILKRSNTAGFGALYGPVNPHTLSASVHRTAVNAFKITINLKPLGSDSH